MDGEIRLLVAFGWTSALNYAFGLAASRILGPGDFGLLAFAQAILLLAGFLLQSGVPWTLTRDLVRTPDPDRGSLVRGAVAANLGLALALAGLVVAGFVAGPLQAGLEDIRVALLVATALPLISLAAVWRAASQGLSAFGRMGVIQAVEVTGKTIAGLSLAAAGLGALGAVAGFAVGALLAAIVGAGIAARRIRLLGSSVVWPRLVTVGPMFGALLGLALILNLDLMAMKLLVPDRAATGEYQAAVILANAPYFLVSAAIVPVLFTRLAGSRPLVETRGRTADAVRLAVALVLPLELLLIAAPEAVLGLLFPPAYAAAAPIVRLMAVGNAVLMFVAIVTAAHQAVGRSSEVGRVLLLLVPLEVAGLIVLVPRAGAMGAVACFDAAALVAACLLLSGYVRAVGGRRAEIGRWTASWLGAVAGGAVVAVVALLSVGPLPAMVLAGGVYYGLVFLLGLVPELRAVGPLQAPPIGGPRRPRAPGSGPVPVLTPPRSPSRWGPPPRAAGPGPAREER